MRTHDLLPAVLTLGFLVSGCAPQDPGVAPQDFPTEFPEPDGRALRAEDYYTIQNLRGMQLSPDGGWVAYALALPVEETNGDAQEVWVVPTDGSMEPRHVLHDGADVMSHSWTDGGRLLYSAGGWWSVDPADPGNAPRAEGVDPDPGNVSPDGFWVASLEEVSSGGVSRREDLEPAASDIFTRHEERFQGIQFDWLNFQRDGVPLPAPDPTASPRRRIVITPVEGASSLSGDVTAEARTLTDLQLHPGSPVWHPSSHLVAFTADPNWQDETLYARTDVWLVNIVGQMLTRVTDDGWNYGSVAFSPDGRFLSYTGGYGTDMIKDRGLDQGGPRDLFLVDLREGFPMLSEPDPPGPLPLGLPKNLTAEWDLDPNGPLWSPDSEYIYFRAEKEGGTHLFRVAVSGGEVEQITSGLRSYDGIQISEDFSTLVYALGRFETPAELYASEIDGSGERRLTRIHERTVEEISFSRAERLLYSSYDGTPIEGWLLYPYGYDPEEGPYPLIVHSHGGPHSASGYGFSFKHQLFAANGYFVLQTNFRSSTGYGEAFKWATWGAWGDKDGEDVMAGIDYALQNFSIDPQRVASIGHSYGGFMTNWLISRYPDRFVAAAPGAGIVNWVSDYGTADIARTKETEFFGTPWETGARNRMIRQSPLTYADQVQAATLFIHGEVDQRVPYSEAEQMFVALKKNGVPAKVIQYKGQSHGIRGHWNSVHRMLNELAWFDKWMKSDSVGTHADSPGSTSTPQAFPELDMESASVFAGLALHGITREYPNKLDHVMNGAGEVLPPSELHPIFFGSYDWHSCVHGHWLLVRLLKRFPDLPQSGEIRAALNGLITPENVAVELAYLGQPSRASFERTYGWAWLLKLTEELHGWDDPDGRRWGEALKPLARAFVDRYMDFLPKQDYPIRRGVHPNTAFGISFALDYARVVGNEALEALLLERARTYFGADTNYPAEWEPDGDDFFSRSLMEADLMRRVLGPEAFSTWFHAFLPGLADGEPRSLLEPADVSDRTDPKIVHLDGLNLSRAWCMRLIAEALPEDDPAGIVLRESALRHAEATLPHITSGNYAGEHWLATFAVYMLTE